MSIKPARVRDFCTPTFEAGRFEHLHDVIGDKDTVLDWAKFEALEVANVYPSNRFDVALLHRTLDTQGLLRSSELRQRYDPIRKLDLRRHVVGKQFPGVHLANVIPTLEQQQLTNVEVLDLSSNNLLNDDLQEAHQLCAATAERSKSFIVNLSGNRFTPQSVPSLYDITRLPAISFVFVPEIGTVDAKDQLASMKLDGFSKLIFIFKHHLAAGYWRAIVPEAAEEACRKAHEAFYVEFAGVV
eukprot:TRINITY_DN14255_c0_g1_i1.p1 TRINITY_DN14255_c0_g1~~TRINITY_DN14255_c0_g1_i1.p1  ORF type:complete len:242 (+),score=56.29 TRINITY_DN14255_c0_g1_i1:95-820(+)